MAGGGFRFEIQALRAIAVLAVLVFHIWPDALPGGYVGVDVFFVISGYLITGILFRDLQALGRISIGEFYVLPAFRRQGVGAAAVRAILDDHHARGTYEVEAGILRDNFLARAFWARMGFELRFYQTARRP